MRKEKNNNNVLSQQNCSAAIEEVEELLSNFEMNEIKGGMMSPMCRKCTTSCVRKSNNSHAQI